MGALHAGHLSLIRLAAQENDQVFVSIYVNPTQFGLNEDLDSYPKTWSQDINILESLNAELKGSKEFTVFAPTTGTMYPTLPPDSSLPGTGSFVTITPLANLLEGKTRPVFFRGVATVCMKLFNICSPERVYFGQKDIQQTVIIKRIVKDFHLNTSVRVVGTSREPDGLAMSSRNVYLGARRRNISTVLYRALQAAEIAYTTRGKRTREEILAQAWEVANSTLMQQESLEEHERVRFEVDYLSLADPETLEEVREVDEGVGAVLSGAIKMLPLEGVREGEGLGLGGDRGAVRLIDNIILGPVER
ncbi:pantoate-beta-alanine ligase [Elasticomyces elasticus]|nr:pantoate-beta-alanine ligase [Elasticomyces elasticus]